MGHRPLLSHVHAHTNATDIPSTLNHIADSLATTSQTFPLLPPSAPVPTFFMDLFMLFSPSRFYWIFYYFFCRFFSRPFCFFIFGHLSPAPSSFTFVWHHPSSLLSLYQSRFFILSNGSTICLIWPTRHAHVVIDSFEGHSSALV